MQYVAVGSTNPAKVEAVRRAFDELYGDAYRLAAVATDGGVDQPWGETATRDGAAARARAALMGEDGHWGIGLEGGLAEDDRGLLVTSWIAAVEVGGAVGLARTAAFYLPDAIAEHVRSGQELAEAWRLAHGIERVGRSGGTVGRLTHGRLDRTRLYSEAIVIAVTQARP